jgi:prepilin-type N-terminal cleavage/methylation domain-containing protein
MRQPLHSQSGFNLPELMIAMAVMLLVAGAATTALLKMGTAQATIWNRTQMHSGIRGATEVLQQEVGQAGRISLSTADSTCTENTLLPCLKQAAIADAVNPQTINVNSVCGMFIGQKLTVDPGTNAETVTITKINNATADPNATSCPTANTISAGSISGIFATAHASLSPIQALGGFVNGIVPTTVTNGSGEYVLKLFGDINADGNMVYVEYSVSPACICQSPPNQCTNQTGNLYRNSMAWNKTSKTSAAASQILLSNITANPRGSACFTYQPLNVVINGTTYTFVTDVAVTLTVQTQAIDAVTRTFQTETKALLNVSPRNVFNTWELASAGYTDRKQSTPATVTTLLAGAS